MTFQFPLNSSFRSKQSQLVQNNISQLQVDTSVQRLTFITSKNFGYSLTYLLTKYGIDVAKVNIEQQKPSALWGYSVHRPTCKPVDDGHLWIWIYPWISTENLWIWIWIWMNNFISTASLVIPATAEPLFFVTDVSYCCFI